MNALQSVDWLRAIEAGQARIAKILHDHEDEPTTAFREITQSLCEILQADRTGIWIVNDAQDQFECWDFFEAETGTHRNDMHIPASELKSRVAQLKSQNGIISINAEEIPLAFYSKNKLGASKGTVMYSTANIPGVKDIFVSISRKEPNYVWSESEIVLTKTTANFLPILVRAQERSRAEQKLKQNISLLTGTLESTDEGIVATDLDRRITLTNHRFLEMIGKPAAEADRIIGTTIREHLIHKTKDPARVTTDANLLYSNPELQGTHRIDYTDGLVLERYSRPQRIEGKIVGRIFSYRDITQKVRSEQTRTRLEQELRQAQKLEAIGTLAGGIAHDFNNILSGITCNIELTRGELPPEHPALASLDEMTHAARRAASLVKQILTFSRQETLERTQISIDSVMKEAVSFMRAAIPKTVTLEVGLGSSLPPVLANATQLHQVFMNLCINAWHAIGNKNGTLRVAADAVSIAQSKPLTSAQLPAGEYLKISVSDTGCGMDAKTIEHIFEPFFTTKTPGSGTGLGLSVVHGIVHNCGGAIDVTSAPDQGTRFDLYFPVHNGKSPSVEDLDEIKPFGQGKLVLLLHDEPKLISTSNSILERLGFRVAVFDSPETALVDFARAAQSFHGVICDFAMPSMNGLEFAAEIHALRPTLPIIVVTDNQSQLSPEHLLPCGVSEVLVKPLSNRAIRATLSRVLS